MNAAIVVSVVRRRIISFVLLGGIWVIYIFVLLFIILEGVGLG